MSIRLKLTLLFVALIGVMGLLWAGALVGGLSYSLGRITEADVRHKVVTLQDYLRDLDTELAREPGPPHRLALTSFDAMPRAFSDDGMFLQLTALDGSLLNKSTNLGAERLPTPVRPGTLTIALALPHLEGSPRLLMVSQPLRLPGRGTVGWVQAAYPLQGNERTLQRLRWLAALSWLAMVAAAFGVGYFFAGRALAPVAAMTDEVRRMQSSDLHQRLAVPSAPRDEIEKLAATFNDLFERLELAFAAQRRFVADASHELKSPLTGIRGNLDLIRRRGEGHPQETARWASNAIAEVDRLIRLVGGLLELAHAGEGALMCPPGPVDLTALAHEVIAQYQVVAPRVSFSGPEGPVWVLGDADRLKQVLINLVDNAVRATRAGGAVTIEVAREAERVRLRVADTGIGMPPEALERIFDRFYRVDQARDRAHGGSGLGLAITQAIVRAHAGALQVWSEEGVGTRFDLWLPAAPEGAMARAGA